MFSWFVNFRETHKGCLPRGLFKLKGDQLYDEWLEQNLLPENVKLKKFSNCWIQGWEKEHGISLTKPNKWFPTKKKDIIKYLLDYLQNIWQLGQIQFNNLMICWKIECLKVSVTFLIYTICLLWKIFPFIPYAVQVCLELERPCTKKYMFSI